MSAVRVGYGGRAYHYETQRVALDGSGNATVAVVFDVAYPSVPVMTVVGPVGNAGTFSAASVTVTGFNLTVAGGAPVSSSIDVVWFAHQKL